MGASVSLLLSSSKAPDASSNSVPHRSGRLELVIAASGSFHFGVVLDEPPINVPHPEEAARVLLAPRGSRLLEPADVLILHLQLPPAYEVAQIRHLLLEQVAFLRLEGDARATKGREYVPEVFHVLPRRLREDDEVVEVHEATLPLEPPEDHVDGPLEGRWGVRQTKGEADVAICPLVTDEGRLVTIIVRHGDLPTPPS